MNWVLNSYRVGRFRRLVGSEFQTAAAIKVKERCMTKRIQITFWNLRKLLAWGSEDVCTVFDMSKAKLKSKMGVVARLLL